MLEENPILKFVKKYGLKLNEKAEKVLNLIDDPSYTIVDDFQSFLDMRRRYSDPWTRSDKWPMKITCEKCNENLKLSPADLDGSFVFMFSFQMQSSSSRPSLTAVAECPSCDEPLKIANYG